MDTEETIDLDRPATWVPGPGSPFAGRTQAEAYDSLVDGLCAEEWAFKRSERGRRLRPESSISDSVLPLFDEYYRVYRPDDWAAAPSRVHEELIEWRKRELLMAHRWESAKVGSKRRGSWMAFGWLLVLLLLVIFISELFSSARQRERGREWGALIVERMRADQQPELAGRVEEYLEVAW